MSTDYKPAEVAEVATIGQFVCGFQFIADTWDCITGDIGTVYFIMLDANDDE